MLARLYSYALRLHIIRTFHATRIALKEFPLSRPEMKPYRTRTLETLEDLANQSMETVPRDFREDAAGCNGIVDRGLVILHFAVRRRAADSQSARRAHAESCIGRSRDGKTGYVERQVVVAHDDSLRR